MLPTVPDGGTARSLVFHDGDRVTTAGRFVRRLDGDWLDLARVIPAIALLPGFLSSTSVEVVGVDADAVPATWGSNGNTVANNVRVYGRWHAGAIMVGRQSMVARRDPPYWPELQFAVPTPPGGWSTSSDSTHITGITRLREFGAIICDAWIRLPSGATVLRVAAADLEEVERVLGPQLPRRLCAVQSRFGVDPVREVREKFEARSEDWGFEISTCFGMDGQCQPFAEASLTRVSDGLASWVDSLPRGLVKLTPYVRPA
jgi:hypothetical protein